MRQVKGIVALLATVAAAVVLGLAACGLSGHFSAEDAAGYEMSELELHNGDATIYGQLYRPSRPREGAPFVVVSHGFGGTCDGTAAYARRFAEAGVACYAFDFCGGSAHSRSDGDIRDMSVLTEADDLEAVMDGLVDQGYASAGGICLMGESQGGLVSALVAARRPEDVAGLVLFYPALSIPDDARERFGDATAVPDEVEGIFGITVGGRYYEDILGLDPFVQIGAYAGPVTIYHGDKDDVVPIGYSQRAAKTYDNAVLHEVSGAAHGFSDEQLDRICAEASDFMAALYRPRPEVLLVGGFDLLDFR